MMEAKQREMRTLMREVLDDHFLSYSVRKHTLAEDLEARTSRSQALLVDQLTDKEILIEGTGVGLIDAFFNGLVRALREQYPSLNSILFRSFSVTAEVGTGRSGSKSDSLGKVTLEVDNQAGRTFVFSDSSRSVTTSCIKVTLSAVEYFVNSERAFFRVRELLEDAQVRQRPDMVKRYTDILSRLVQNASYAVLDEA